MDQELREVRRIFEEATELAAPEREAFLRQACEGRPDRKAHVEALLAALGGAARFLAAPTGPGDGPIDAGAPIHERAGSKIGPYKLLQLIGEGGFGTVFMAEQTEPVVRRVALKIIKLGMDTRQVIARFEAERQALAMMDHPNIAKVFDAGATDTGRPFFVMELVKGDPITGYCDRNNLGMKERLELFAQVCNAVQHAHQKGIIHRDIKPSNVLVTLFDGKPVPKVIDFGIAKATNARLTEKTLFTELRQLVGTPEYMSPEQAEASGVDIDTRSDIYSLGVLLYELLTGSTPVDSKRLRSAAYGEIQRIIREEEPPKPSTRLSTMKETLPSIAAHRHAEPGRLTSQIKGDLDWIVMKALEKDRTRRYETANELAADLHRHLAGEPVVAAPPSSVYRVRKFARRHRVGVLAGGAIALVLVLGIVGTTTGMVWAVRAQREQRLLREQAEAARAAEAEQRNLAQANALNAVKQAELAQRESAKGAAVNAFLRAMLGAADPERASSREVTVQFVLDEAAKELDAGALRDQPEAEAAARTTIGKTYASLGLYEAAELHLRRAVDLSRTVFGDQHAEYAAGLHMLGVFLSQGKWELPEANRFLAEALAIRKNLYGDSDPRVADTLEALAVVVYCEGRSDLSEPMDSQVAEIRKGAAPAPNDGAPAPSEPQRLADQGWSLQTAGDYAGAESHYRAAIARLERSFPHDHPRVAGAVRRLASMFCEKGDYSAAEPLYRDVLEIKRAVYGDVHVLVMGVWADLIQVLFAKGDQRAALQELSLALDMGHRMIPGKNPAAFSLESLVGTLQNSTEAARLAEPLYREALEYDRAHAGRDHPLVGRSLCNLASVLVNTGDLVGAESHFREGYELRRRVLGDQHADTLWARLALGQVRHRLGRTAEAESDIRAVYEIAGNTPSVGCATTDSFGDGYAGFLVEHRRFDDAERVVRDLSNVTPAEINATPSAVARRLSLRGMIFAATGQHDRAERLLRDSLRIHERLFPDSHPRAWWRFETMSLLGGALAGQAKFAEAEPLLLDGYKGMKDDPRVPAPTREVTDHTRESLQRVVALYEVWDRADPGNGYDAKGAEWRRRLEGAPVPGGRPGQ